MSNTGAGSAGWRVGLVILLLITSTPVRPIGQSVTVKVVEGALQVQAPESSFGFIEGAALERLHDGRSLRVDVEFFVLAEPRGVVVAERRQSFNLSYDLWEERFAVSRIGTPPQSISHLSAAAAETWCLEQLGVPLAALTGLAPDAPFWVRLAYRIQDPDPAPDSEDDARFTLRSLINMLSQRGKDAEPANSVEAGPFRLPGH